MVAGVGGRKKALKKVRRARRGEVNRDRKRSLSCKQELKRQDSRNQV